jgi:hypothetical protein
MISWLQKLDANVLQTQCSVDQLRHDVDQRMVDLDSKLDMLSMKVADSVGLIMAELRTLRGGQVDPTLREAASHGAADSVAGHSGANEQGRVKAVKMAGRLSSLSAATVVSTNVAQGQEPIVSSTHDARGDGEDGEGIVTALRP